MEKHILEQVEKIRQLRSQGASDEQIMKEMKLSHGAYQVVRTVQKKLLQFSDAIA